MTYETHQCTYLTEVVKTLCLQHVSLERNVSLKKIVIDDKEYDLSSPSENALVQLRNINFVDQQILQRNNELQISETARMGYKAAFEKELAKAKD